MASKGGGASDSLSLRQRSHGRLAVLHCGRIGMLGRKSVRDQRSDYESERLNIKDQRSNYKLLSPVVHSEDSTAQSEHQPGQRVVVVFCINFTLGQAVSRLILSVSRDLSRVSNLKKLAYPTLSLFRIT